MSSSVDTDNKKKGILIVGIGPTQWLDDTTLLAESQYSINFLRSNRKFYFSSHYNESNLIYLLMLQKYINAKQKILK